MTLDLIEICGAPSPLSPPPPPATTCEIGNFAKNWQWVANSSVECLLHRPPGGGEIDLPIELNSEVVKLIRFRTNG